MALSDTKVRSLKPREKAYKVADEKGLYLQITPTNAKYWRFKFRFAGKEKKLALGVYPDVSLADARNKRDEARKLLANDVDPSFHKKEKKRSLKLLAENSFESVALEWHIKFSNKWTPDHADRILQRLKKDVFPWIGNRPISGINAPELLSVLRRIEDRGAIETAHRTLQNCGQIFRYAIATGRAERDISSDLRGALQPVKQRHHASITDPKAIGSLLRAINDYQGHFVTKCALRLAPLVFVRPGELRQAEWAEFNFETNEWHIPAQKMKMREKHIVPLSRQALTILNELKPLTGNGKYLFPGIRTPNRPMSNNTVLGALRRLGYTSDEMTGHGFRSMACTLLNEQGWNRDAIERQLAHAERNSIRAAYNYAEHLPERRKMMQKWADYLDELTTLR
ncbi:phage integrase central domain-containing protein [Candidatus Berkiella aquae]|uniref:Prophage CP4-57 integrase n=1 Tax=Candidatus Berkiella aquae TaxID=295108 RepID=A0A0Q9YM85_9GAMM|nr:integrase arm-type DNA-binding domain-containing protein [Candidatus Berkiella aquae]MCS5710442.1 tyrosine-type recombinase/integrase [Candidatus Berkiella aquae]